MSAKKKRKNKKKKKRRQIESRKSQFHDDNK